MDEPLVINVVDPHRHYLLALGIAVIGCLPFVLYATEIANFSREWPYAVIGVLLIIYSFAAAGNTFLGYPVLRIERGQLEVVRNPFLRETVPFDFLGPAQGVGFVAGKRRPATAIVFRAEGKAIAGPLTWENADARIEVSPVLGGSLELLAQVADRINKIRGL